MITRRHALGRLAAAPLLRAASGGVLYEGFAIAPRKGVQEATLGILPDGRYILLFGEQKRLAARFSTDKGRTWGPVHPVNEKGGAPIVTGRDNVHLSLLRLQSGGLGMVYGGPYSRPGVTGRCTSGRRRTAVPPGLRRW